MGSKGSKNKKKKITETSEAPPKSKKKYNSNLDIDCAKDLVKLCLSQDMIYKKYLDSIINLDDPQFENLFGGKVDAKYDIDDNSFDFSQLVRKFEDYRKILYNFYTDKKKHEEIAKLWKKDANICSLSDLPAKELFRSLDDFDLSFKFKEELISLIGRTLESQSENIFEFLKEKALFLVEFYNFSKKEIKELDIKQKDDSNLYGSNINNMLDKLLLLALPPIKGYLKTIPNLEPISKKELEDNFINKKIKKIILKAFKNKEEKSKVEKTLYEIVKKFMSDKNANKIFDGLKNSYNSKFMQLSLIGFSLMNLNNSIKNFNYNREEFKKIPKEISRKFSNIVTNFEIHRAEIGTWDFSKPDETRDKIKEVHNKICEDKLELSELIKEIESLISEKKKDKIKNGINIAISCIGIITSIAGIPFTGGASLGLAVGATAINGISLGLNSANVHKINSVLSELKKLLDNGIDKEKEIQDTIDDLEKKI